MGQANTIQVTSSCTERGMGNNVLRYKTASSFSVPRGAIIETQQLYDLYNAIRVCCAESAGLINHAIKSDWRKIATLRDPVNG